MADIMTMSTREFARGLREAKALARSGVKIRIKDRDVTFRFEVEPTKAGFLGATKGTLKHQAKPQELYSTGAKWDAE